ncbi:MAG: DNA primase [DPANN group archaeon]|nr:DNA primase [DPANN group archaeon]
MGKISPVSIKYVIHAKFELSGIAEKPDIIGAIFGQTEGLLGSNLELRELQKFGRIGRIDVNVENKDGKTSGEIILPSSMGKTETAIIGASLETIERVGPCEAKVHIIKIDDTRVSKRDFVKDRAQELLKTLVADMPDSQELTNDLNESFRSAEVIEYGIDKLAAGPEVETSKEIIVVEGRADVLTLLRYGIKNAIALQGTKVPRTLIDLAKDKTATLFVDGDRGGELIIKKVAELTNMAFVAVAPDGKEVEELTGKEILKALRIKIPWSEAKEKIGAQSKPAFVAAEPIKTFERRERPQYTSDRVPARRSFDRRDSRDNRNFSRDERPRHEYTSTNPVISEIANKLSENETVILDKSLKVLGKVPKDELADTLEHMDGVYAVALGSEADAEIKKIAYEKHIKNIVSKRTAEASTESTAKARA